MLSSAGAITWSSCGSRTRPTRACRRESKSDGTRPARGSGRPSGWKARPKAYIAEFRIVTKIEPASVRVKAEIAGLDQKKYQIGLRTKDLGVKEVSKTFEPKSAPSG